MRVIVGCEESGRVRDAFIARGHDAVSCDIIPTSVPGPHIQGDIREVDLSVYDLAIFHPPCTYLTVTGNKWFKPEYAERFPNRSVQREDALELVEWMLNAPVERIALENPVGIISTRLRKPSQYIQPWQFGHQESKKTCLWLQNLPPLQPTEIVEPEPRIEYASGKSMSNWYATTWKLPKEERARVRSVTFQGIADAMADQWGSL